MRTFILVLAVACGGKAVPQATPAGPAGQDLTEATSLLCAAPTRAEADLEYHTDDSAAKAAVLAKHMKDRITNARVLALIDGWKDRAAEQKVADLDQLTHDALLSSKCRLRELWATPADLNEAGS